MLNTLRKRLLGEIIAPLIHLIFWQVVMRRALRKDAGRIRFQAFYTSFAGPAGAWRLMQLVRWGRPEDMLGAIPSILAKLEMPSSSMVLETCFPPPSPNGLTRSSLDLALTLGISSLSTSPKLLQQAFACFSRRRREKKVEESENIGATLDCSGHLSPSTAGL
jgi:hypothetical protein